MEKRFTMLETVQDVAKISSYYVLKSKQRLSLSRNFSLALYLEISIRYFLFFF